MTYNHKDIDKKWQKAWEEAGIFEADDKSKKKKFYCLIEFPYPSGAGLHIGHPRSYTALDAIARKRRMEGFNVLYPIGWDAFGLPTENYAIKTGRKPQEVTVENIDTFRRQLKSLGLSFDWSREVNTTDPNYYKWTQWMFLQFFKNDLAYKQKMPINWCLSCKIGLANEEVVNGVCERCGGEVEKRDKEQWMIAITKYADRLLEDLDSVDYLDKIKKQQVDWIGRSEGAEVSFVIASPSTKLRVNSAKQSPKEITSSPSAPRNDENVITVFTTRPDTLFGATFMVLAPEHPLVGKLTTDEHRKEVEKYVKKALKKSEFERGDAEKEKTGVFTGAYAVNPVNDEKIPIWVADYVLMGYGTGAIMAVPAHDERDFAFAMSVNENPKYKYDNPIKIVHVVEPNDEGFIDKNRFISRYAYRIHSEETLEQDRIDSFRHQYSEIKKGAGSTFAYTGNGFAINSGEFDGLETAEVKKKITKWLEKKGVGKAAVNYKLRDWVFSRQRYWGEPIPLVNCEKCGWVAVPDDQLPVELPDVEKYEPTDTGESPLAAIEDWVNTKCPDCGGPARRETDTMPNWAGSSWYFLRYCDPHNHDEFASAKNLRYWMPVDWYNGGMEHTTLHLLYSRFWNKFLHDHGHVPVSEPYARRTSHGLILAEDGEKMSKSRGNVINPDDMVEKFGADTLRVYEMFIGPFGEAVPWSTNGVMGVKRFLDKVMRLPESIVEDESEAVTRALHQTIRSVGEDIEDMKFNTAVAKMMTFVNVINEEKGLSKESLVKFVGILCPFAPHVANELYESIGGKGFVEELKWPKYDEALAAERELKIAVQVNGKLRGTITVPADASESDITKLAREHENVTKYLKGDPKKTVYVEGRLVNFLEQQSDI